MRSSSSAALASSFCLCLSASRVSFPATTFEARNCKQQLHLVPKFCNKVVHEALVNKRKEERERKGKHNSGASINNAVSAKLWCLSRQFAQSSARFPGSINVHKCRYPAAFEMVQSLLHEHSTCLLV